MMTRKNAIIVAYVVAGVFIFLLFVGLATLIIEYYHNPDLGVQRHGHGPPQKPPFTKAVIKEEDGRKFMEVFREEKNRKYFDVTEHSIELEKISTKNFLDKDAIELNDPEFLTADHIPFSDPRVLVMGANINGEQKAYLFSTLDSHFVINDRCGGKQIAVVFDPIAFNLRVLDREIIKDDGTKEILTFGPLDKTYNNTTLLFDKNTESIWYLGERKCVVGELIGTELKEYPSLFLNLENWVKKYPQTAVQSEETGYEINYRVNLYKQLWQSQKQFHPIVNDPSLIKTSYGWRVIVLGIQIGSKTKAYPICFFLDNTEPVKDLFQETNILIFCDDKESQPFITDAEGETVPYSIMYWYVWNSLYPDTEIYEPPQPETPKESSADKEN